MSDTPTAPPPRASAAVPISAGLLTAIVGFASSFAVVLAGLQAVGATPEQAASGLIALSAGQGLLMIVLAWRSKLPLSFAWSTPGAALLVSTGMPHAGFAEAVGAFLVAAGLIVAAGLWRRFGQAVEAIPTSLASAMLAGVLLNLCLAPIEAIEAFPWQAAAIIVAWAVTLRFARLYAVLAAVAVAAVVIPLSTPLPEGIVETAWPVPVLVMPTFSLDSIIGISLPLFLVTMASQNIPGLAVLNANGYRPAASPLFVTTGVASAVTAFFGGHMLNLAAITAALCAGPDAHPDPKKRYIASLTAGGSYIVIALLAGIAAAFATASPPLLIQTVAGLALLASLAGAAASALSKPDEHVPAIVTFVTTASGLSILGIGAAFWGLLAGGAMLALLKLGKSA
ncbi:benzoate/H(+) symporter BenE family transporter [Thalassobaculum salexigens]|uniref:benzoate/H(+) symporter BenE family transporter n=1 Tax=Thalassobaculum salexigens TaxID=455360 RepID=UPI00248F1652|nr:benzoate/H(+) symporter BenE family transporter [Thalassobaculum salexigens]